jgi:hypothetical protein
MGKSNMKGDIAELAVAKRFLEKGYYVSYPFGDDAPYDLVVDINNELKRVQVKYVSEKRGVIISHTYSSSGRSYRETCDLIVLYSSTTGDCYLIDLEKWKTEKSIQLRLQGTKNKQIVNVNLAENYLL